MKKAYKSCMLISVAALPKTLKTNNDSQDYWYDELNNNSKLQGALTLLGEWADGLTDGGPLIGRENIRNFAIIQHVINILHKSFVFDLERTLEINIANLCWIVFSFSS